MSPTVAVVGAGVIGAAIARSLAGAGAAVTVFDPGVGRAQSTWASAGLLIDGAGHGHPYEWHSLARRSIELWHGLGAAHPGIELRRTGLVLLSEDAPWLEWREAHGYRNEPVDWHGRPAMRLPEVMSVRPTRLAPHLLAGIDVRREHVSDIASLRRSHDAVVVAAGAWAEPLLRQAGVDVRVAPRRGQMMVFGSGDLPHAVHEPETDELAVPRADGRVVVGTTVEDAGFDASTDARTLNRLERWARATVPRLGRRESAWAGLRPWSDRELPTIASAEDGVVVAVGHFRNGVLLAPATAERVRDLVLAS